jgi:hypothetical protein
MLSITKQPSKTELVKNIQILKTPKIQVIEVLSKKDRTYVIAQFNQMISKGNFSIIFVQE